MWGVIIEKGPTDWQIIQQEEGYGEISLSGTWEKKHDVEGREDLAHAVYARIIHESTYEDVVPWQQCHCGDGTWNHTFRKVPSGGLYKIQTILGFEGTPVDWGSRGDSVNHIGVGDLFVIAGQSNAVGYARGAVVDPPDMNVHFLRTSGKWDMAVHPFNDTTASIRYAALEHGNTGHSPFLHFAKILTKKLGYPIGLLPTALGGSPLSAWNKEEMGQLYDNMMDCIRDAGGKIKGVLWYQGCTDAEGPDTANSYLARFTAFVQRLRKDLNAPVPLITYQLNRFYSPRTDIQNEAWSKVRDAQYKASLAIEGVSLVTTADGDLCDAIHNGMAANMTLGERGAKAALCHIYGIGGDYTPPMPESARVEADGCLHLRFAHVIGYLRVCDDFQWESPFTLEDASGAVKIVETALEGNSTLRLRPERKLQGAGVISCGNGANFQGKLPFDMGTGMPCACFYRFPITIFDE